MALTSLLLMFGAFEIGFRVKAWSDDRGNPAGGELGGGLRVRDPSVKVRTRDIIRPSADPRIVYELVPGVHATYKGAVIRINTNGFRGEDLVRERAPGEIRIFGLGDSVMFGWGVAERDSYMSLVAEHLRKTHPDRAWKVINSAVPGYNTAMEVATLERKLLEHGPDLVLIHYVDNDRALPNFIRNPRPYLSLRKSFLWRWTSYTLRRGLSWTPDDRLARRPRDPSELPPIYVDMIGTEGFARAMAELSRLRDSAGFAVLLLSSLGLPAEVGEIVTSLGITAIDGRAAAARHLASQGLTLDDYGHSDLVLAADDPHPSALGHRILAGVVADHLERSGLVERLEQRALR